MERDVVKPRTVHQLPVPQEDSRCFCPQHLGNGVAKENDAANHWMEQIFTHIEKRQSKISSNSLQQSLMASRSSPTTIDAEQLAYKNLSPASVQGPSPSPMQSEILKAGHVPEGH